MFSKYDFMTNKQLVDELRRRGIPRYDLKASYKFRLLLLADDEKKISEFIGEDVEPGHATEILPAETSRSKRRARKEKK
jgi:hypothetical protein